MTTPTGPDFTGVLSEHVLMPFGRLVRQKFVTGIEEIGDFDCRCGKWHGRNISKRTAEGAHRGHLAERLNAELVRWLEAESAYVRNEDSTIGTVDALIGLVQP